MATTPVYTVNNPVSGTHYGPSNPIYWCVPNAGTTVTTTVQSFDSNGNLLAVSSIYAQVWNHTAGVNADTFGGGTYNTINAAFSGPNGSDAYQAFGWVNVNGVAYLKMWVTYTGQAFDQPPNAPSNLSPSGLINTLTPTMTGSFSDPTSGDTLSQYQIQVTNAANGGGATIWDSGNVNASTAEISAAAMSRAYGGPALAFATQYSWRARMSNQNGNWGSWSNWINFNTAAAPNSPANVTPNGLVATLTPGWSFLYSSPGAYLMQAYEYQLLNQSGGIIYDTGTVLDSVSNNGTASGTVPSGYLAYGSTYSFSVRAQDTNGVWSAWTTVVFNVAARPQVSPLSPIGNATVNTQTPTFSWNFLDPNYAQKQFQVRVYNATTAALIQDSGVVSSGNTSWTMTISVAYGTQIYWTVQVWDTVGLPSDISSAQYAYVNNVPTVAITQPTNGGTVTTATPVITWTYTPSSGGFAQSSVTLTLMDSGGNVLATYTQSGAGTSYTLPAGVLLNTRTYKIQVAATDTNADVGTSAITSFTLAYTVPADMQGQPLTPAKNFVTYALLNVDTDVDGVADGWNAAALPTGATAQWVMDNAVVQPVQLVSGDGPITTAQSVVFSGASGMVAGDIELNQLITLATTPWIAGTTRLSLAALVRQQIGAGTPYIALDLDFLNSASVTISSAYLIVNSADTNGQFLRVTMPNKLIPSGTAYVQVSIRFGVHALDSGQSWVMDVQLEAATANDPNFIEGSLGTGFSYDANGYSVRTQLAGTAPTALSNPGSNQDPYTAQGGSLTITWDTALADPRFAAYLLERRRLDQQTQDSAWLTLALITNNATNAYVDLSAGNGVTYQYSLRQLVTYADGSTGASQHRAIIAGSVYFSPGYYLVNQAGSLINLRLNSVAPKRSYKFAENAVYTPFLGRVGQARDAGPASGYDMTETAYFNPTFGDDLAATRRLLIQMQEMGAQWLWKTPSGMVIPVWLSDITWDIEDTYGDQLMTVQIKMRQAADTNDF